MEVVAQKLCGFKQVLDAFVNEELNQEIINVLELMPGLAARTVAMISNVKQIGERQKAEEAFFVETRKGLITDALNMWLMGNEKDLFYESQFKVFLVK